MRTYKAPNVLVPEPFHTVTLQRRKRTYTCTRASVIGPQHQKVKVDSKRWTRSILVDKVELPYGHFSAGFRDDQHAYHVMM